MTTHQSIGGMSDDDLLQRMVTSHAERYNETFWTFFDRHVGAHLPSRPLIVDLGCGPGLFLRDVAARYPQAVLHGYDLTPAMIAYARELDFPGPPPTFGVHDVSRDALPLDPHSADLVCMTAVLHVVEDPLTVLAEIKRILAPDGMLVLHDWVRAPLQVYLASRVEGQGAEPGANRLRWFRLFPVHNKYTEEDWYWLLSEAGYAVQHGTQIRPHFRLLVTRPLPPNVPA